MLGRILVTVVALALLVGFAVPGQVNGSPVLAPAPAVSGGPARSAAAAPNALIPVVLVTATQVSAGGEHTCALTRDGGVKCWGGDNAGQLGGGAAVVDGLPLPDWVSGLYDGSAMRQVDAGGFHTCAVTSVGGVKCWGFNGRGALGDGTTTDSSMPVDVYGLGSGVMAVAAGDGHTCALTSDGGVKCWGANEEGQLGDFTSPVIRTMPVDVVGLRSGVVELSAGGHHTCAVTSEGGVKCWGANVRGELGVGFVESSHLPVDVTGLESGSGVRAVSAGGNHTCVVTSDGGGQVLGLEPIRPVGRRDDHR